MRTRVPGICRPLRDGEAAGNKGASDRCVLACVRGTPSYIYISNSIDETKQQILQYYSITNSAGFKTRKYRWAFVSCGHQLNGSALVFVLRDMIDPFKTKSAENLIKPHDIFFYHCSRQFQEIKDVLA